MNDLVEKVTILRLVNGLAACADYAYPSVGERLSEVDGGLTAEGRYNSERLLEMHHVHHVLGRERLKIELVGGGVIGRDGLGIVVDDYRFIAELLYRAHGVDGGVIEFNALTDAYRPRAEHDYLRHVGDD